MTENTERAQVGWGFWLWWGLASIVGLAVGFAVAFIVVETVFGALVYAGAFGAVVADGVFGAVMGASLGIAQWLVLRRHVSQAGWWVLASSVGLAVGFAVFEAVGDAGAGAVVGASVGIPQWLILREQVSRAGWWVLASIVGSAVTWAAFVTGAVAGASSMAMAFAVGAMAFLGYGAITGAVMVWLLRQPDKEQPSLPQDAA